AERISPTEREFDQATVHHKTRLIFLTHHSAKERHPKQNAFIEKVQASLIRKRFTTTDELKSTVYASLVNYLIEKEIIRTGPFDASLHPSATLADLDTTKVIDFVRVARAKRGFKLQETDPIEVILTHLNLINEGRITQAAILLFGKEPQRFFINSEVRCAFFQGMIIEKPIASYKVFKGDVFELVDQAEEFVLSKLDYAIGTRSQDTSIPGKYEIPKEIVAEALVNAIAHRDYTNNGSVQVMVFKDRVEIFNPGTLPLGWTTEKLKKVHTSVPANPLLAEPMYLKGYIERLGTGTADMVRIAKEIGLKEPEFEQDISFKVTLYRPSTDQVPQEFRSTSVEVKNLVKVLEGEMSRKAIQDVLELKHEGNFRENYLEPALKDEYIQMKYPDSPNHPKQRYLLTPIGIALKNELNRN
ncbi:MAG: ATP-binding protein, partial [Lutibacter sp.]